MKINLFLHILNIKKALFIGVIKEYFVNIVKHGFIKTIALILDLMLLIVKHVKDLLEVLWLLI